MKQHTYKFDELEAIIHQTEDTLNAIYQADPRDFEQPLPLNFRVLKEAVSESERLQREHQKLLKLYREQESYTSTASQIFLAPLRRIEGFSRMLMEDYGKKIGEDGKNAINTIIKNAEELGNYLDDYIAIMNLGRKKINRKKFSVEDSLKKIFCNVFADTPSAELHIENLKKIPLAYAEPDLAHQAIEEILINVKKFSKNTCKTEITAGWDDDQNAYFIQDNGIGFDTRYADTIFDLFSRLNRAESYEGTGAGLAFVKKIFQLHEGKVWADGSLGEGAVIYFNFGEETDSS
jgi:light-regulated signal transduction histidine kinase (bacteriophytochrome)